MGRIDLEVNEQIENAKEFYYNVYLDNKSEESYFKLQKMIDDNYRTCIKTGGPIFYYDSDIRYQKRKKQFCYLGKNCQDYKTVNDKKYFLSVSEKGLVEKYPEYNNKNKRRLFNTVNKFSKFAYDMNEEDANKFNKQSVPTLENLQRKYGEEEGKERFERYKEKQSYTNSLEYFKETRDWNEEDYEEYNKSRAVTLENLQRKYGEEEGKERFERYKEKQSYTNSLEYFIGKYGEIKGTEKYEKVNFLKSHTFESYMERYDDEEIVKQKLKEYQDGKQNQFFSKKSQIYFKKLDKFFPDYKTYFATKDGEYSKLLKSINKFIFIDYFISELNVAVEYNGSHFHADPKIYDKNDKPNFYQPNITAKEIWEHDKKRINVLEKEHGIKTLIIWENREISPKKLAERIYELRN